MQFVDSHSHIDFVEFDHDRSEVITRAFKAGISDIIVSSTVAERWPLISNVVNDYSSICHAAYGLHPMFMPEHKAEHLDNLKNCLKNNKAVAVGEIGLDFFIDEPNEDAQISLFVSQLEIASEFGLPVIIHARKSLDIVLKQLRRFPDLCGSIHSFSGSAQQAKQLIELGFYLGFGGPITYTRATKLRKLLTELPLDALLIETDSPDQPDYQHHGQRNEPAYLLIVAQAIAELRNIDIELIAKATTINAQTLFKV